jgi:capsular exopolysaccharide synthesis family protein
MNGVHHLPASNDQRGEIIAIAGETTSEEPSGGLFKVLARKWRTCLVTALVVAALGITPIWLFLSPEFTATSAIEVAPVISWIAFEDDSRPLPLYTNYVNTQAALIRSNRVLYGVLEDPAVRALDYFDDVDDPLVHLQENLAAVADKRSQLLLVSMTTDDAGASAEIANAAVRTYMRVEGGNEATSEDQKLRTLEQENTAALEKLRGLYESANQLAEEFGAIDLTSREELLVSRIQALQDELSRIETSRITLRAQSELLAAEETPEEMLDALGERKNEFLNRDPFLAGYAASVARLEQEYSLARARFEEGSNELAIKRSALDQLRARLEETRADAEGRFDEMMKVQLDRARKDREEEIANTLAQLDSREQWVRGVIEEQQDEVLTLGRRGLTLKRIEDEIALTRELSQTLQSRLQILRVERKRPARIRVAYNADEPREPSRDKRAKYSAVVAIASLLFGAAFTLMLHRIDTRVESPSDVEAACRLRVLGTTPRFEDLDRERIRPRHFLDDCRTIRVNLMLAGEGARTIVVASPQRRDGKTTLAVNLATSMALSGKRVVLVDGDLRKPEIARYLSLDNSKALSNVLTGECTIDEAVRKTPISTLEILPGNRRAGGGTEILSGEAVEKLFDELKSRYDAVVVDTPAVLAMPDAKIWASAADGVVMVARSSNTGVANLTEARERIEDADGKVLGVVLTAVRMRDSYEKYYHRYTEGRVDEPLAENEWDAAKVFVLTREAERSRRDGDDTDSES